MKVKEMEGIRMAMKPGCWMVLSTKEERKGRRRKSASDEAVEAHGRAEVRPRFSRGPVSMWTVGSTS